MTRQVSGSSREGSGALPRGVPGSPRGRRAWTRGEGRAGVRGRRVRPCPGTLMGPRGAGMALSPA